MSVRAMAPEEFDRWQDELAVEYAREHVSAGNWTEAEALDRAREANAALLPDGLATPGMLLLIGVLPDGSSIGRLWIGLTHPRGVPHCAFIYDIEVVAERRGQGLGRALLAAGERMARERGARALELNVFGANETAATLYRTSGYQVVTQQMRKDLLA
ncbi:GNAT family N-acetyltransferase [Micromonospora sp. DT227]|uniref:GNAT family N-acetyltransferase n=1 Tax=Micromonospora sp. DT227 TaxID=3393433 RepID=UPI003CE8D1F4